MATMNPFDLLLDDDAEDPNLLIAAAQLKVAEKPNKKAAALPAQPQAQAQPAKSAKLPSKPLPPAQAVRESKYEGGRGAGRGGGRGSGRGRGGDRGFNRDISNDETSFGSNNGFSGGYRQSEEGDSGKPSERRPYGGPRAGGGGAGGGGFRGARRGGFSNGEDREGERPRRTFDRRSGTGRGGDIKRDGTGRGNWGNHSDDIAPETEEPVAENEKNIVTEQKSGEEEVADASKENPSNEPEEKEPEDKEMTLEEYEKIREEKRKALLSTKAEERKIDVSKEFGAMQQLSNKKANDEIFIKLGSEKDKKKDAADKDDKAKKSVSINEFLKPAEGERYFNPGGRGRGRGRDRGDHGSRGGGGYGGGRTRDAAPPIADPIAFPTLGGK